MGTPAAMFHRFAGKSGVTAAHRMGVQRHCMLMMR
jgi:hypothetical protein